MRFRPLWLLLAAPFAQAQVDPQAPDAAVPAPSFPALRRSFAGANFQLPVVVIAFAQKDEPVILTAGTDAGSQPLSDQTLVPLGVLARLLVADALWVQHKQNVAQGSGVKFGDRELLLQELLAGIALLPDYFAWEKPEWPVDRALLQACGDAAAASGVTFRTAAAGFAELVLLEPLAFGRAFRDWPTMLRATLGPHVPGLDPLDARDLSPAQAARVVRFGVDKGERAARTTAQLAAAEPAPLRLLLSAKNLAAWWQWRALQAAPAWVGPRMGQTSTVPMHGAELNWWLVADAPDFACSGWLYPERKAGIVLFTGSRALRLVGPQRAFETDLLGAEVANPPAPTVFAVGLGGGVAVRAVAPPRPVLRGTRWRTVPGPDGAVTARLQIDELQRGGVKFTWRGRERLSGAVLEPERGLEVLLARTAEGVSGRLLVWPRPEAGEVKALTVVLVEDWSRRVSLPRVLELVPDEVPK